MNKYQDERITECDLEHVVGIQSTNGASLHFTSGHGSGVGVYPVQAFLNHDCRFASFSYLYALD